MDLSAPNEDVGNLAEVVAENVRARASENDAGRISAERCVGQANEAGAAAYHVVLAEVAEVDVVAEAPNEADRPEDNLSVMSRSYWSLPALVPCGPR